MDEKKSLMILALIAAMTPTRLIGKNNTLPWKMPSDLAYFKKMTQHKIIIMGRKTFDSMGRALPNRRNIVITRDKHFNAPDVEIFYSLESAIAALNAETKTREAEVFVIGGAQIYTQALLYANKMYLTFIEANIEGDAYFPEWSKDEWQEVLRDNYSKDVNNPYDYSIRVYERK